MKKFFILIPLYNDWESVSKLLNQIDSITTNWNAEVSVIIVNDASTEAKSNFNNNFKNQTLGSFKSVSSYSHVRIFF